MLWVTILEQSCVPIVKFLAEKFSVSAVGASLESSVGEIMKGQGRTYVNVVKGDT
jgi:hypothetical protein